MHNAGVVFKLNASGQETVLHTFTGGVDGGNPCAGVAIDSAGNIYGTAYQGGISGSGVNKAGAGVVFKIDTSGLYTVLYSFKGGADGSGPYAGVVLDSAGNLYGTTYNGGASNGSYGVIYKVGPSGQETVLHIFKGAPDGAHPFAGMVMDPAGNLYGTTYSGGAYSVGAVYKLSPSGQETVLYSLGHNGTGLPSGGVILDAANNIYGAGGSVIFKLDPSGGFTMLGDIYSGAFPTGLARDPSGNLYFATAAYPEGDWPNGAVFKLDTTGKFSLLYQFKGAIASSGIGVPVGGSGYNAGPILDADGNLYGTTPYAGTTGIVYEIVAGGSVKRLYNFQAASGGSEPGSSLTLDAIGNLYGSTENGGPANVGVVYKLAPSGQETVLYSFKGGSTDGAGPGVNIVLDTVGNLYGVTSHGGTANQGVVYKLSPSGQETILHSFTGGADGALPIGLTIDPTGNLYGTTAMGGSGSQTGLQEGVVFKVDTGGGFSVLHSFTGLSDGGTPEGLVILDTAGNLYGTTFYGGIGQPGAGVVFEIGTAGVYSVLHAFAPTSDGGYPGGSLAVDAAGNLYGTCSGSGPQGGGTLYKLTAGVDFSLVFAFPASVNVGSPGGVAIGPAGGFYGSISVAAEGCPGTPGACGMIYKISPSGTETVIYNFTGGSDGAGPTGVTLDGSGHLYGAAIGLLPGLPVGGGGVVYKITLP